MTNADTTGPRRVRSTLARAVPAVAWAAVIFAGSSVPGTDVPGGWSVQGHLGEYAVFGALVLLALARSGAERRAAWMALAICSAYAVTDEFHQSFVPGRMPDPLDWVADAIGSAVGISAALIGFRWRALRRAV